MRIILEFNEFILESDKIYRTPGDPYEYKVVDNIWMTKGKEIKDWKSLSDNQTATDILDSRHPEARKKISQQSSYSTPTSNLTQSNNQDFVPSTNTSTMICSHAGKWDGPGASKAENCLKNIEENIKAKIDMVEIDIQITADGVPVLFHDSNLDSKTNGKGKIQNMNWNQVRNISYNSDPSQKICSLQDVVNLIKKYSSKTMLQLDKCDAKELSIINKIGMLRGIENQIVAKGQSYSPPSIVKTMGIKWMPILPTVNVGKIKSKTSADEITSKAVPGFFEYQFSDADSYILNGYLSDSLRTNGVYPMVVAVGGTKNTNGASYRGDSRVSWEKIVKNIKPSLIMTNHPNKLKSYLK
jgi:hypothetical protein